MLTKKEKIKAYVKNYLRVYTTRSSEFFNNKENVSLAVTVLLKDDYSESDIKSGLSKFTKDIKNKVPFKKASASFLTILDTTSSSPSTENITKKEMPKEHRRERSRERMFSKENR